VKIDEQQKKTLPFKLLYLEQAMLRTFVFISFIHIIQIKESILSDGPDERIGMQVAFGIEPGC
jgi:hypothetical protein